MLYFVFKFEVRRFIACEFGDNITRNRWKSKPVPINVRKKKEASKQKQTKRKTNTATYIVTSTENS